jgi:uroporphyrinogen-III synthase
MGGLQGKRIVVTRPKESSEVFARRLREEGALPVVFPSIEIQDPEDWALADRVLTSSQHADAIIFGSRNAVERTAARAEILDLSFGGKLFAVGKNTGAALGGAIPGVHRFRGELIVPERHRSEGLMDVLDAVFSSSLAGKVVLWPRSPDGREMLGEALRERGVEVREAHLYRICALPVASPEDCQTLAGADVLTFFSGESLVAFFDRIPPELKAILLANCKVAVIGPVAAEQALRSGVRVDGTAREATPDAMIETLLMLEGSVP